MRRASCSRAVLALALLGGAAVCDAAETSDAPARPSSTSTQLVLKLASDDLISVNTKFQEDPPTILIQFPAQRIIGSLPESSAIGHGAVQSLQTIYSSANLSGEARWIQEVRIRLKGAYPYEVRSQAGSIVVEVQHPVTVASETLEVGLTGGIIVSGAAPRAFSERFRAMEEALRRAMPDSWRAPHAAPPAVSAASALPAPAAKTPPTAPSSTPLSPWVGLDLLAIAALTAWLGHRTGWWRAAAARLPRGNRSLPANRVAPEVRIVDQLVWRAFERKGFQLLQMLELEQPLGLMRLMVNDGHKAALLCVGDGLFFEKTVVEGFQQAMEQVSVQEGFLVAPGSFTVPAQRLAKESGIALIGREQLIELLSEGAVSEHFTTQLHQLHDQVHHAKITLEEYARQLETLRRQRNEATWFLGEERTKSAELQARVDELTRQIGEWQAQATQWQQAAELTRKQWEESQWYLGEARAAITHLEGQLTSLQQAYAQLHTQHQELSEKLQETERQRDEAQWFLGESRTSCEILKRETQQLAEQLRATQRGLEATRRMVEHFRRLADGKERRASLRLSRADVRVQVHAGDGAMLFDGAPRDVSATGLGLTLEPQIDAAQPLRIRLSLPGMDQPIETGTKLVWRQADGAAPASGHEFIELGTEDRDRLQRAIAELAAAP